MVFKDSQGTDFKMNTFHTSGWPLSGAAFAEVVVRFFLGLRKRLDLLGKHRKVGIISSYLGEEFQPTYKLGCPPPSNSGNEGL